MKRISQISATLATLTFALLTSPVPSAMAQRGVFMGNASTGEPIYVLSIAPDFYGPYEEYRDFVYSIGDETLNATAICAGGGNTWIVEGYGTYEAKSEATRKMVRYVCEF